MPGAISATASGSADAPAAQSSASRTARRSDAGGARKRLFRGAERRRLGGLLRILVAAHPAIDERRRRLLRRGDRRGEIAALDGAMADRIGRRRIAGEREGLAAAAAPIDLAPLAGLARLEHPIGAAEAVEGVGVAPDRAETHGADRGKIEIGQG